MDEPADRLSWRVDHLAGEMDKKVSQELFGQWVNTKDGELLALGDRVRDEEKNREAADKELAREIATQVKDAREKREQLEHRLLKRISDLETRVGNRAFALLTTGLVIAGGIVGVLIGRS